MRWFWIDRFLEFVGGKYAVSVKAVTLSETHVLDYVPSYSILTPSFIVEGFAQTGGLLVSHAGNFKSRVVLAKIASAKFYRDIVPSDVLVHRAEIQSLHKDGAIVSGKTTVNNEVVAEIEMVFAQLDDRFEGVQLFEPAQLLRFLRSLKVFEVGLEQDGSRITPPQYMLDAESLLLTAGK